PPSERFVKPYTVSEDGESVTLRVACKRIDDPTGRKSTNGKAAKVDQFWLLNRPLTIRKGQIFTFMASTIKSEEINPTTVFIVPNFMITPYAKEENGVIISRGLSRHAGRPYKAEMKSNNLPIVHRLRMFMPYETNVVPRVLA